MIMGGERLLLSPRLIYLDNFYLFYTLCLNSFLWPSVHFRIAYTTRLGWTLFLCHSPSPYFHNRISEGLHLNELSSAFQWVTCSCSHLVNSLLISTLATFSVVFKKLLCKWKFHLIFMKPSPFGLTTRLDAKRWYISLGGVTLTWFIHYSAMTLYKASWSIFLALHIFLAPVPISPLSLGVKESQCYWASDWGVRAQGVTQFGQD